MGTFDERVQRALALLSVADSVKRTQTPALFNGVRISPVDTPEGSDRVENLTVHGPGNVMFPASIRIPPSALAPYTLTLSADDVTTIKKMRLYTAGCISGDDRPFEEKAAVFYVGADALRTKGYEVVNPLDVGNDNCFHGPEECQQHTMRSLKGKDQGAGHSWECYLRHDLIEALQCDGIAMLPGWEQSPGARMEFEVATRLGIPAKALDEWEDLRRPRFTSMDPATGITVTGYRDGDTIHIEKFDEAKISETAVCDLCSKSIHKVKGTWFDRDPGGGTGFCPVSKDPVPVHVVRPGTYVKGWDGQ